MIGKVLLAIDGSQNSLRAAEHAFKLMQMNRDMAMTVLNVIPVITGTEEAPALKLNNKGGEPEKSLHKRAKLIFDDVMMIFNRGKFEIDLAIEKGDAGEIIASHSKKGKFELIVMGLRGQHENMGRDLGSVSHKVLCLADCPVTLVK